MAESVESDSRKMRGKTRLRGPKSWLSAACAASASARKVPA